MLDVTSATKTYPGASAPTLDDVSLHINRGEAFVILGATGSGKSTLLRSIAGLESLDAGSVRLDADNRLAVVFQQAALFPWLSVRENVLLGGKYKRNAGRVDAAHIDDLLSTLGISELANRRVSELSGGQAQRVSIARALAIRPSLLLLDEPFSALDPVTRAELQRWLRSLIEQLDLSVVMVSHDVSEALTVGDRIGFFEAGRGFTREWSPATESVSQSEILDYYRSTSAESRLDTGLEARTSQAHEVAVASAA